MALYDYCYCSWLRLVGLKVSICDLKPIVWCLTSIKNGCFGWLVGPNFFLVSGLTIELNLLLVLFIGVFKELFCAFFLIKSNTDLFTVMV